MAERKGIEFEIQKRNLTQVQILFCRERRDKRKERVDKMRKSRHINKGGKKEPKKKNPKGNQKRET